MHKGQKQRLAALLAAVMLLLTGCSLDVENLLQPPRAQGAQQAVQAALETYLKDSGLAGGRYTLKYPSEGEHISAFVLCDDGGKPTAATGEQAAYAVVFYSLSAAPEETHVNLLHREREEWVSVGDSVGYGADIRQVAFGDLNGDGCQELLTGWSTYHSKDNRLAVFSLGEELQAVSADLVYTKLYVGDLTATGPDSLLLLHIGGGNEVTATLQRMSGGHLVEGGRVRLDGYIQQFGGMTLCRLADGVHGLYVDGVKSAGTMVTELIYYDGTGLVAPFYDGVTNVNAVTARPAMLPARDIDGDALVEIPSARLLPGFTEQTGLHSTTRLTTWRVWDYAKKDWRVKQHTVWNSTDGYTVTLSDALAPQVTTAYDETTRTLDLLLQGDDRVWLRLCVGDTQTEAPAAHMKRVTLFAAEDEKTRCEAWYDAARLDEEKVRYMVARLTTVKGE